MIVLLMALVNDAGIIAVQHEGRVKPLDTFAREWMRFTTGREDFEGYDDPETGEWVRVFSSPDPVESVLALLARPREFHGRRFLQVTHPGVKERFRLDVGRTWFSMADLEPTRDALMKAAREIGDEETSLDRAVLKILHQYATLEALLQERLLAIVPIPQGEKRSWMSIAEARRRPELRDLVECYDAAVREGDASRLPELAARLRAVDPSVYPSPGRLRVEIAYNRIRPFHRASLAFFLAALAAALGIAFESRIGRWSGTALLLVGLAVTAAGYAFRWIIAERYPLSNHYESMVMCAFAAAAGAAIFERVLRSGGWMTSAGGIVASVLLVLANQVPAFAEQGFVAPLVPALQSVWMTLHVPVIMTGYALGMLLMVLGHVALFRQDTKLDRAMQRVLQMTVLFLLVGIVLGAVWAGEAWGRPWGWDMKETWALVTLLSYLAILHGRHLGALRAYGTAVGSLGAFQVLILTYYGVNFVFGKGLHTYGFGAGEVWPLIAFFAAEGVFVAVAEVRRRTRPRPEKTFAEAG